MSFKFNQEINGVQFDINFQDRICIIKGHSGTGKSFLFDIINSYCVLNNIRVIKIDYHIAQSLSPIDIINICKGKDIILLDNADLYLTPDLWNKIRIMNATIIISKKTSYGLNTDEMHLYSVKYTGTELETIRR